MRNLNPYSAPRSTTSFLALLGLFFLPFACAGQTAKVGVYYFEGWYHDTPEAIAAFATAELRNHFPEREPIWGGGLWRGDTVAVMEQQIDLAADHGIAFFSFDWYWYGSPSATANDGINSGLKNFMLASNRGRMEFNINIVDVAPTTIDSDAEWVQVADMLLPFLTDSRYLRVGGNPLITLFNGAGMTQTNYDYFQQIGVAAGFPAVEFAANVAGSASLYSHVTRYNAVPGWGAGETEFPYLSLTDYVEGNDTWADGVWNTDTQSIVSQFYIPTIMAGWDARPWNTPPTWYFNPSRTPAAVGAHLQKAIDFLDDNPTLATPDRLVMIYAWNEYGEGGYIAPTLGDPNGLFLDAIKAVVSPPSPPPPDPDFDFTWGASTGIFFPSLSIGVLSNLGDEVLAQLYLAPDDQMDGEILPGGGTNGDDVVLESFVVRNNGGVLEQFGVFQKQFQATFQSGTLYAVLFSTDSPIGGDRYYRGPGMAATNAASLAGLFDLNVGPESGNTWTGTVLTPDPYLAVRWLGSWGFLDGLGVPILPGLGDEALVQLIYSPDGVADGLLPGGLPGNNDVVIDARIVRNNGGQFEEYAFFGFYDYEGLFQPGFIYGVIYDSAVPQGNDEYYAGPLVQTVQSFRSNPACIFYDFNTDPVNGNTWNGSVVNQPLMLIDWRGGAGFIDDQGNSILPNLGDEALVQLIYSPDGVADTILPGGLPADDDVVIDTRIVRNNGGLWEDYGLFNWIHYQGPYQSGFIYAVAYENTDPQAGARYYAGPMQATVETPPGSWVPTTYEMNIDFVLGDAWNGTVLQSFMHYQWSASFGFLDEQGNPILPNPGDHTLIQLIYSPDGLADPMLPGGVPAGNDTVLYSTTVSNSGGFREGYGFFGPISYSDSFAAGFVYGTIYQDDNPQGGERYFSGHLQATAANDVSNPHPYEMNNDLVDGDIWNRTVASGSTMRVSWYGSYGFIDEFSVPILPVVGDEAAIRLMYTPDNMRDPILPGGIPGENDVVLAADTVRNNGGQDENWAFFGALVHHGYYQAGYIYGIIYEDIDPQAGDDFYVGPLQATQTGGGTAQYDLNTDFVNGNTWNDSIIAESAMLDFDLDGLPNHFETIHFGNATIAEANMDSDFDGRLNLAEYIADTDPTNGSSFFGVESLSKDESDIVVILRDTSVNRGYVLEMDDGMFGSGSWPTADAAPAGTGAGLPFIDVGAAAESTRGYRGRVYIP